MRILDGFEVGRVLLDCSSSLGIGKMSGLLKLLCIGNSPMPHTQGICCYPQRIL